MTNELKETGDFEGYMLEICDLLENGDASIDFAEQGQAHEATVIRIIANLVRDELDGIKMMREMEQWLKSPNELPRADDEEGCRK